MAYLSVPALGSMVRNTFADTSIITFTPSMDTGDLCRIRVTDRMPRILWEESHISTETKCVMAVDTLPNGNRG